MIAAPSVNLLRSLKKGMKHLLIFALVACLALYTKGQEEPPRVLPVPSYPSIMDLYAASMQNIRALPDQQALADDQIGPSFPYHRGSRTPKQSYMDKKNDELSRLAMRILKRSRDWESQAFSKPIINFARVL